MGEEHYYEMLWDCPTCKTLGLLAKSQRHCPACGQAQNPAKRYFPEPGQEVEAQGHAFVGADWRCAYCKTPNSSAAGFCCNCGAPKEGGKPVEAVADPLASPPVTAPEPPVNPEKKGGKKPWLVALAVFVIACVVGLAGLFFSKHEESVEVTQSQWQREIEVERFMAATDSAWCDALPGNAYSVTRSKEVRSHRKVPDGQECHEKRVDKADGTFVKQQECSDKYREEPIYADKCRFRIDRWQVARTVKASGDAGQLPAWPSAAAIGVRQSRNSSGRLGDERTGQRHERYVLNLANAGKSWQCEVPQALWERIKPGDSVSIQIRAIGGAVCDSIMMR